MLPEHHFASPELLTLIDRYELAAAKSLQLIDDFHEIVADKVECDRFRRERTERLRRRLDSV